MGPPWDGALGSFRHPLSTVRAFGTDLLFGTSFFKEAPPVVLEGEGALATCLHSVALSESEVVGSGADVSPKSTTRGAGVSFIVGFSSTSVFE